MRRRALIVAVLLVGLLGSAWAAADEVEKQRERLQRASGPVERARITAKLGDALLDLMARAFSRHDTEEGAKLLAEYREAIELAGRNLLASGRDARRRPRGFKDLEIHLRKGERRLEDMSRTLSYNETEALQEARQELESLRQDLLAALMGVEPDVPRKGSQEEPDP